MKDLRLKKDRITELETQLQQSEERRQRLEMDMSSEEKEMKIKFLNYEKNLEQLTLMYHQLASHKNLLSKD
jgi:hypothetical protein